MTIQRLRRARRLAVACLLINAAALVVNVRLHIVVTAALAAFVCVLSVYGIVVTTRALQRSHIAQDRP